MLPARIGVAVTGVLVTGALATGYGVSQDQQTQDPRLKIGVELVSIDAQVVSGKGEPIIGLSADQFEVKIGGKRRRVATAELLHSSTGLPPGMTPTGDAAPRAMPGNIYILAVDQGSFRAVNASSVTYAVREFLKRIHANDYVGMVSFPGPGVVVNPSRDRAPLEQAIPTVVGFSAVRQHRQYRYSLSDAIDVAGREAEALTRVTSRNCQAGDRHCALQVEAELNETVSILEAQASRSLSGVRAVLDGVKGVAGRKTVVVISAGIPTGDRLGGRLYMHNEAIQAADAAIASGVLLYTLHLNSAFLDAHSPEAPSLSETPMREAGVYGKGLDMFNAKAGGTLFEVNTGADFAIDRMMREMSAYYLLGVEVEDADRTGRSARIEVKVNQRGANVRNRASVTIPVKASR